MRFSSVLFVSAAWQLGVSRVESFAPMTTKRTAFGTSLLFAEDASTTSIVEEETTTTKTRTTASERLASPLSFDDMVGQASRAMREAYEKGITRQIVRVLLPRDPTSGDLGVLYEKNVELRNRNVLLVPPDESWQGGIMQLYRAVSPTCEEILRRFSKNPGGIPPRIQEDRSVDESGVDGVGLWMTENQSPADDVSCFVQPTQETVDAVEKISKQAGDRLVVLLNPQWRNIDDALDTASKSDGVFAGLASFLGGKGNSLRRLEEMGYKSVFTLEGYICKGINVRLMQRLDSDWAVFAENESTYTFVGTSPTRPSYQVVDTMLSDNGFERTLLY